MINEIVKRFHDQRCIGYQHRVDGRLNSVIESAIEFQDGRKETRWQVYVPIDIALEDRYPNLLSCCPHIDIPQPANTKDESTSREAND